MRFLSSVRLWAATSLDCGENTRCIGNTAPFFSSSASSRSKLEHYRFLVIFGLLLCGFFAQTLHAQPVNKVVTLYAKAKVPFVPDAVLFLVSVDGINTIAVPGVSVIDNISKTTASGASLDFIVGTKLEVPEEKEQVSFSVILKSKDGRGSFVPKTDWIFAEHNEFGDSVESLRTYLLKRKEALRSWQVQVNTQEDSLRRLRADADVIANVSRIVDVQDDAERLKQEVESVNTDIENLKYFLKLANLKTTPKNFARRELDLTKQLAELAQVTKQAESSEFSRRSMSEADLQRKMAEIEETRDESVEALSEELTRLKEGGGGSDAPAPSLPKSYWEVE